MSGNDIPLRAISLAPDDGLAHDLRQLSSYWWKGTDAYSGPKPDGRFDYWGYHIALSLGLYEDAQEWVERLPDEGMVNSNTFLPKGLLEGWIHQRRGDSGAARESFESARDACVSRLGELADDDRAETALGHAFAGLGSKSDAVAHGERAVELVRSGRGIGSRALEFRQLELARIFAQVGEVAAALDLLDGILRGSFAFSVKAMEFDPFFDSLRDHPRYIALVEDAS